MGAIFAALLPVLRPGGHCVINVPDMWWENQRITIHIAVIEALRQVGSSSSITTGSSFSKTLTLTNF